MDRRTLLRLLLATAAAEAVDFEQLLWVPKPIITVPSGSAVLYLDQSLTAITLRYMQSCEPLYYLVDQAFPKVPVTISGVWDDGQT